MNRRSIVNRFPMAVSLIISAVVCLSIIGLRSRGDLEFLELAAYDQYLRWQSPAPSSDSRIVLITISEDDIQKQGRWPLTDLSVAHLLRTLIDYHPRAIGLDLYRDIPVPPGGEQLATLFSGHNTIVTTRKMGDEHSHGVPPPYLLDSDDLVGFNDILVDPGGVVRRGLLFLDDGTTSFYSFALLLAMLYLEREGIFPQSGSSDSQHLRLGQTTFIPFEAHDGGYVRADARGYQFLLDFKDGREPFKTYTLTDLLGGDITPEEIQDKIVIIGITAESLKDFFFTPLSRGREFDQKMAGVELHARTVSQLLRSALRGSRPMASMDEANECWWIVLWGLIGGAAVLWRRSFFSFALMALTGILTAGSVSFFMFMKGWWIPSVPPALAFLISAALVTAHLSHQEKVQRAILMQLFSRHVSENVAEAIWRQRDQFMDGGRPRSQRLTATVLFTDLKGFTGVSEKLNPQALMSWLNEYMETMARLVIDRGGVINKYIGDAIMAIFGIPLARISESEISRDAVQAVDCALAMAEEIRRLNTSWKKRNLPTTRMRIGIFTGPLIAGSLGSAQRMEYTVIGDTVNIASRLESYQKDITDSDLQDSACRILIGEETLQYLGNRFQAKMVVGRETLRGKKETIGIYRVTGRAD